MSMPLDISCSKPRREICPRIINFTNIVAQTLNFVIKVNVQTSEKCRIGQNNFIVMCIL